MCFPVSVSSLWRYNNRMSFCSSEMEARRFVRIYIYMFDENIIVRIRESLSPSPPSCKTTMVEEKRPSCSSCSRIVKKMLFSFREIKKRNERNERNDEEALSFLSLSLLPFIQSRSPHFAAMISRVSEIFLCGFRFISLYFILTRFFPRTSRASKNLASSLFAFLSRRRSAMDRNKRRIPFEESLHDEKAVLRILFYRDSCGGRCRAERARVKRDYSRSFSI